MDISYLGQTAFKVKTKTGMVLLDPISGGSCDIVTASFGKANLKGVTGTTRREKPFVIEAPGEYEIEGISVFGFQETAENTLFVLQAEDLRIVHLGQIGSELSEKMINDLDGIDAVMVPVSKPELAIKLVEKIDPYYVIPMGEKAEIDKFVTVYGRAPRTVKSLAISKLSLPQDATEVIVFE